MDSSRLWMYTVHVCPQIQKASTSPLPLSYLLISPAYLLLQQHILPDITGVVAMEVILYSDLPSCVILSSYVQTEKKEIRLRNEKGLYCVAKQKKIGLL